MCQQQTCHPRKVKIQNSSERKMTQERSGPHKEKALEKVDLFYLLVDLTGNHSFKQIIAAMHSVMVSYR